MKRFVPKKQNRYRIYDDYWQTDTKIEHFDLNRWVKSIEKHQSGFFVFYPSYLMGDGFVFNNVSPAWIDCFLINCWISKPFLDMRNCRNLYANSKASIGENVMLNTYHLYYYMNRTWNCDDFNSLLISYLYCICCVVVVALGPDQTLPTRIIGEYEIGTYRTCRLSWQEIE